MSPSREEALAAIRARAVRREAIATALLAAMAVEKHWPPEDVMVEDACDLAEALIAELDRRRQAEEAQA